MNFDTLPAVTRATVTIELADGTAYTYTLPAAHGAKVGCTRGRDLDRDLGPIHDPPVPRLYGAQAAFVFPLPAFGDRGIIMTRAVHHPDASQRKPG